MFVIGEIEYDVDYSKKRCGSISSDSLVCLCKVAYSQVRVPASTTSRMILVIMSSASRLRFLISSSYAQ